MLRVPVDTVMAIEVPSPTAAPTGPAKPEVFAFPASPDTAMVVRTRFWKVVTAYLTYCRRRFSEKYQ